MLRTNWIYQTNKHNSCRFVLGIQGEKPLICIGLNPSTAMPGKLDPTMRSVQRIAFNNGYDSWIMLNLYPKRVTHPKNLPKHLNIGFHHANLGHIKNVVKQGNGSLWAAWGTLIETRPYFIKCLYDIMEVCSPYPINWYRCGNLTKAGHPRHPLYLKATENLHSFDQHCYLKK